MQVLQFCGDGVLSFSIIFFLSFPIFFVNLSQILKKQSL